MNPIEVPDLENLTNDEIVASLLDVNRLRREMEQVSEFFVPRQELGVELAILKLFQLYIEGQIRLIHFVDMDIDHVTLTRDEQRSLFNLIITVTRRYTPNILQLSLRR